MKQNARPRESLLSQKSIFPSYARIARLKSAAMLEEFPVAISEGSHPFPSRTRKLSPPEPMVLRGKPRGRVGRCRIFFEEESTGGARKGSTVFFWRTLAMTIKLGWRISAFPEPCITWSIANQFLAMRHQVPKLHRSRKYWPAVSDSRAQTDLPQRQAAGSESQ